MNQYIAKTFAGLENLLAQELTEIGASEIEILNRAVSFHADDALLYKANMCLRTALRIIHPILVEQVKDADDLYNMARSVNWTRFFTEKQTIAVHSVVDRNPNFNNTMMASLKAKDAIVDQFRDLKGSRPSVDKENPDIRLDVHLFKDRCTLSIDTSGDALHKRGYRHTNHQAPLNEITAAALVMWSGWDYANQPLIDIMCGSGTILAEAALIAAQAAPNLNRENFGFQQWKNYDNKLHEQVWKELRQKVNLDNISKIIGVDIDKRAINDARENITNAGIDELVRLSVGNSFEKHFPDEKPGVLIFNPPYGQRLSLGDEQNEFDFYKRIGDLLKQQYKGWSAWILGGNLDAMKRIGLKAAKKHPVYNGSLECLFSKYEMY
jgi:putative N6-adenine-specific DNA methylase